MTHLQSHPCRPATSDVGSHLPTCSCTKWLGTSDVPQSFPDGRMVRRRLSRLASTLRADLHAGTHLRRTGDPVTAAPRSLGALRRTAVRRAPLRPTTLVCADDWRV
jgi:hypothetical protein